MKIKKKFKIIVVIILTIILIALLSYAGYKVYKTVKGENVQTITVTKEIPSYGYTLRDDATGYYKNLFNQLSDILNQENVNDEEYAKLASQMFVTDFYTISNKLSKTDVGGTEFVLEAFRNNFVDEAEDTIYKYVEQNVYGDRSQKLPEVTNTEITNFEKKTYEYQDYVDDNSYVVTLKLTYKEDLGYPTDVTVKLLHQDKKLVIFYMK